MAGPVIWGLALMIDGDVDVVIPYMNIDGIFSSMRIIIDGRGGACNRPFRETVTYRSVFRASCAGDDLGQSVTL